MSKYIGRLVNLGIARESTRGEGASPVYEVPTTSFSFDDKVVKARSIGGLSKISDSEEAFVTTKYGQGDVEGEIRSKSFGLFLYAMLGGYSVVGPTDEAYTHSFTVSQSNQHQSLAFVVSDENTTELYKLVMLDSLEITSELDQVVTYSASFMSKASRDTGLTIPAVVNESKFTKKHLSIKLASDISSLGAASTIAIKSYNLKINKNVAIDDVLGTAEPEDIHNRQLGVEGSITLNYEAETYKNYMKNGTNRAMQITLTNTDNTIGAGTTNPSFTLELPKVDFFDWEPSYDLDDIVTQTISFKANRDVANSQDIIYLCQLVNDVVTYDV